MRAAAATQVERPIVMTGESIPAIFADRKHQTRRLLREQEAMAWGDVSPALLKRCPYGRPGDRLWVKETHAQFAIGDITGLVPQCVAYRATCADDGSFDYTNNVGEVMRVRVTKWTPAIYMPRWASRLTLELLEVRVQRIQDITDADARAEGVEPYTPPRGHISPEQRVPGPGFDRARLGDQPHRLPFADRWDEINGNRRRREPLQLGDPGHTVDRPWRTVIDESARWAANPWVWALTFRTRDAVRDPRRLAVEPRPRRGRRV